MGLLTGGWSLLTYDSALSGFSGGLGYWLWVMCRTMVIGQKRGAFGRLHQHRVLQAGGAIGFTGRSGK